MIREEYLKIEETDLKFSSFKNEKPLILDRDIGVLILPSFHQKDAFHNGTIEIFSFLQKHIGENDIELFASDDEYKELALHSRAHWLGVFLVTQMFVPIDLFHKSKNDLSFADCLYRRIFNIHE